MKPENDFSLPSYEAHPTQLAAQGEVTRKKLELDAQKVSRPTQTPRQGYSNAILGYN